MAFSAIRAKEVQLKEYLKDFEKTVDFSEESESYKLLKEVKNTEEFEILRESGLFSQYAQEVEKMKDFVEVFSFF